MSKQGTIKRYSLILDKLKGKQYPSFKEIKEYLFQKGFQVSERTLQRDIEQIRVEFSVEITYSKSRNGYFIDLENSMNTDSFFNFLELVNTAQFLVESLQQGSDVINYISFEDNRTGKGTNYLKPILDAIKNKQKISFLHYNFHTAISKTFLIKPYLLKEYQNRWYVIGIIDGTDEFRTFGVDRIENVELLSETFNRDNKLNPKELFNNIIGVVYSISELQKIVLSFTPEQGKYIKSLPLHNSQKVMIDDEKEVRIQLFLKPNYEFSQIILMHGESVKVIEPLWLATEIKNIAKNMFSQY